MIEPYEGKHGDEIITVDEVSVTYTQNHDCTEHDGIIQTLTLTTRNNGVARFIYVKTDGWSVSSPDELKKILEDFSKRAGIST